MIEVVSTTSLRRRLRLINPRSGLSTISMPEIIRKMTFSRRAIFMPLNLAICAAVVPDGWDVEIVDENVLEKPHRPAADVDAVGIGAMTTQARRAYELAGAYRRLGVPVIMGGIHPSALPHEALRHCTVVCIGDAEGTLPRALADLARDMDRLGGGFGKIIADCQLSDTVQLPAGSPAQRTDASGTLALRAGETPATRAGKMPAIHMGGTPMLHTGEDARATRDDARATGGGQSAIRNPQSAIAVGCVTRRVYDWKENPDTPIATPRKDLLNPKDYLVFNPIQTTRGCPHGCTFCTTPAIFGRKFRQRSIDAIIDEVKAAKEQFNSRVFIFSDDDVAGNHAWAMELFERLRPLKIRWASQCDILISRNDKLLRAMRASGCQGIIVGLESPNPDTLRRAGKRYVNAGEYLQRIAKIHSHRISIWGSFILGFDGDGWREAMNTVRFAQKARLCMSCYPILTPYPGTAVFEQYRSQGRLLTQDWDKYNGATVVYQPEGITVDELRHAQMAAFHEFYSPGSSFARLGIWPVKKMSWMANAAIYRGLVYYYSKKGRPLPRFTDYVGSDAANRIARSLGLPRC